MSKKILAPLFILIMIVIAIYIIWSPILPTLLLSFFQKIENQVSVIAICISFFSLLISFWSLYISEFSKFKPYINFGMPTLRLYKIMPQEIKHITFNGVSAPGADKIYWIPSFDLGVSMLNLGSKIGKIIGFRIVVKNNLEEKSEIFWPVWVVDYPQFNLLSDDRFEWISKAIQKDWYPIILPKKEKVTLHIIMEGPCWKKEFNGELFFTLEYMCSNKKEWQRLKDYKVTIFKELFEKGGSITPYDDRLNNNTNS